MQADPRSTKRIVRYSLRLWMSLLTRNTWPSGWRKCISRTFHGMSVGGKVHIKSRVLALLIGGIDIIDENRHPYAFILSRVPGFHECCGVGALSSTTLRVLAHKDGAITRSNGSECRRLAPIPKLFPPPFLEPRKAFFKVGHIEYWRNLFYGHPLIQGPPLEAPVISKPSQRTSAPAIWTRNSYTVPLPPRTIP